MNSKRFAGGVVLAGLVVALTFALALPALADGPGAVAWLKAQQNADGGFGTPASTVGATADVLLAAAATGENGFGWAQEGGATTLAFLVSNASSIVKAGDAAKVVLAFTALGANPRDLEGTDLVAQLESMVGEDGRIGGEGEFVNEHCYAMIALRSVQRPVPGEAVSYLLERQIANGSWSWNGDTAEGTGDNNTAAMALAALIAAGVPVENAQVQKTLALFQDQQNEDGGFPYVNPSPWGTDSDSNSTAVVMWALIAAGQDPAGVDWKYEGRDGRSALDKLRALQNENGAFRWQEAMPDDNFASTVQAVVALELKTLPLGTMDVGEAQADVPEPAAPEAAVPPTAGAADGEPETLPETGANLWIQAFALLGSGIVLAGAGLWLRRRG